MIILVLLISGSAVVIGVSYALKISDKENNTYYSELRYHLIEQHIKRKLEFIETDLFYGSQYDELRNEVLFTVPSNRDRSTLIRILNSLARDTNLTNYYYQVDEALTLTNGSEEIIAEMIATVEDSYLTKTVQHHLVFVEGDAYIAFFKRMSSYRDETPSYLLFYAKADRIVNTSDINDLDDSNTFLNVDFLKSYTPSDEADLSFVSFEEGYIDISDSNHNLLYIPLENTTERSFTQTTETSLDSKGLSQVMVFYTNKPSIISNITKRIIIIVLIILSVCLLSRKINLISH
jgi:hypothetical protein